MNIPLKAQVKNYDPVAKAYAAFNYSSGKSLIIRSKMFELSEIFPGKTALFVGSGPGEDALAAARKGARVTCIDVSTRMLSICKDKFKNHGLEGRFIHENVMTHTGRYDTVVANYFLNVFNRETAQAVLTHLSSLLGAEGILMIADVSPLRGNPLYRAVTYLSYLCVAGPAALIGLTAMHVPYEYALFFDNAGLKLKWEESFRQFKMGPPLYKTWAAIKSAD